METKILRLILGFKQGEVNNKELYEMVNIKPILHRLYLDTVKFFTKNKYNWKLTENLEIETWKDISNPFRCKPVQYRLQQRNKNSW